MKKILVADNDDSVCEVIFRALGGHEKYMIFVAHTLAETVLNLSPFDPHLVIIDNLDGGGVELGDKRYHDEKKPTIITSVVPGREGTPRVRKGEAGFIDQLRAEVERQLREISE